MADTKPYLKLTNAGAFKVLEKAVEQATLDGVPECIAIVVLAQRGQPGESDPICT